MYVKLLKTSLKIMIYDAFLFYNELEVLDIRLNTLDNVIDKFVLVEGTVTHTNKQKPLYYSGNKSKFKKFHKKIIHIVVKDSPNVSLPWIIERFQFEAAMRGLRDCRPNDVILHGPVDEIPRPEKILEWKDKNGKIKSFKQELCLYFLNYIRDGGDNLGTRMFKFKDLKLFKNIYFTRYLPSDVEISDGGWHFSYIGGVKKIQQKLSAFAHQEFNNDKYNTPEKIQLSILEGRDPFGLGWKFKVVDVSFLPKYVVENQSKFKDLIAIKNHGGTRFLNSMMIPFWELKHMLRVKLLRPLRRVLP